MSCFAPFRCNSWAALLMAVAALGWAPGAGAQGRTAGEEPFHPIQNAILSFAEGQPEIIREAIQIRVGGSYLGITMEDVSADNMAKYKLSREQGVIVESVVKDSPAEEAGLRAQDVILEYSGIPVLSTTQLSRLVQETPAEREVDLAVSRDGARLNLKAKIGKREGTRTSRNRELEILPEMPQGRVFRFSPRGEGENAFSFSLPGRGMTWSGKPRLGVTLEPLTDQMADFLGVPGKKGALVTSVSQGSAAEGKLKAGDVVIGAKESAVADPEDLARIVGKMDSGGKLDLKVIRAKKEVSLTIEIPGDDSKPGKGTGFKL